MFCSKCGAQNPDGSGFCVGCGSPLTPTAEGQQPIQSNYNAAGQPQYGQQPPQYGQQPQQYGQQPQPYGPYGTPVYPQYGAQRNSKTIFIVIGAIGVALAVFLVLLFTVIIPNSKKGDTTGGGVSGGITANGGGVAESTESKIRHKWSYIEDGEVYTYDFVNNVASSQGISINFSWRMNGNDKIIFELSIGGETGSEEYFVSFSSDGRTMTMSNSNETYVFSRAD